MLRAGEVAGRQRLEADEDAAQARGGRMFDQIAVQDRIDGRGALEEAAHAAHAVEQRRGEAAVAEQVIVEEVEMAARQPLDLGERVVDPLGVERAAAVEERVLVAEVAVLRAAARDDDRVRHEVARAGRSDRAGSAAAARACDPTVET